MPLASTYRDAAMSNLSSPKRTIPLIRLKLTMVNNAPSQVPAGTNSTHHTHASSSEPTQESSVGLDEVHCVYIVTRSTSPASRSLMLMPHFSSFFKSRNFKPGSEATRSACQSRSARTVHASYIANCHLNVYTQISLPRLSILRCFQVFPRQASTTL